MTTELLFAVDEAIAACRKRLSNSCVEISFISSSLPLTVTLTLVYLCPADNIDHLMSRVLQVVHAASVVKSGSRHSPVAHLELSISSIANDLPAIRPSTLNRKDNSACITVSATYSRSNLIP